MTELPYIASSGTQYINTGVIGKNGIDVELCVFFTESPSDWHFLLGSCLANVDHSYIIGINALRTITIQRGTNIWYDASYTFNLNTDYTIKIVGTHLYINGEDVCSVSDQSFTSPVSLYLFAANVNGDAGVYTPMALRYCKIWENGVLVRDYIPAIDNGHIGLWDNVSGSFFADAAGGEFIAPIWYIDENGELTNDEIMNLLPLMEYPYPDAVWRMVSGHIENHLYPALLPINHEEQPEPVKQRPYISVYDVNTPQDGFEGNGLAVLQPSQCLVTEVLNGEYTAQLTHPIDAAGKWNYILERNLLKIGGQIFTIVRTDDEGINSQGQIIADCEHVFYQLSDPWIFPGAAITGERGLDLITSADAYMWRNEKPGQVHYYFNYWSDVPISPAVSQLKWNPTQEGMTLIDVILGSNGVAALCGGELYRDNFYFSLNQSMENSEENAFDIHIGFDLTGIRRVFDTSKFCTYFRAYDQYGQWFAVAWAMPAVLRSYSHEIIRSKNYTYNIDEDLLPEGMDIYEASMELLVADGMAYFNKNCAPVMSYTVNIKDVKNNPEYAELSGKPRYKVGNVGRVYDARLGGYVTLKITKTVTDAITGEIVQVTFGDLTGFGQPKPATPTAIIGLEPVPQGGSSPLRDKNGDELRDKNNELLESRVV